MGVMEVDKSKCLICEVSCPQKGLAFFKFPKEELRLKMWIKEISPLLDILKIQPNSLKENGRICARHFREKDFINCKQNSLVRNACPSLSVSNLSLNFQKVTQGNKEILRKRFLFEKERSNDGSETDIFQCGKCKTQFEIFTEFIDHKRFRCQLNSKKLFINTTKKCHSSSQNYILSVEKSVFNNSGDPLNKALNQNTENFFTEQTVKIIGQEPLPSHKIVSMVMEENRLMIGNSIDISTFPNSVILAPQLPFCFNGTVIDNPFDLSLSSHIIVSSQTPVNGSVLLNNIESEPQASNLILAANDSNNPNKETVYMCPIQNHSGLVITSEDPINQDWTKNEVSNSLESTLDLDQILTYSKLSNLIDASQEASSVNLPKRKGREEMEGSNQAEDNSFEKPKTKLPCSYCGKRFEKLFNLQQHERIHTGERPFQCIICGRAFTQKSNVRKHMMRHRVWPKGKQTLKFSNKDKEETKELVNVIDYSCQYCTLSFKSYAEHKKHLTVHSNFKVYRCIQKGCSETFSDLDEFLSHSKMHSSAEFQCHICLKAFSNLEELGVHQYDHDKTGKEKRKESEIKLKCKVCHARFKTTESLKNHLAVDTHNYECIHCKSVFCSERFLRRHLFIHMDSSQSAFKCQHCRKSFRTLQNLNNHLFIHLKEKPFTCDYCNKQFASKYRLKRHLAIHLNQYLDCPFKKHLGCDKTFYRKDKLREHVSTHSHCKVRSCRICSKLYWTMSKLHKHLKRDHKTSKEIREVFKCFGCSPTLRKQKQLSYHHYTVEGRRSNSLAGNLEGEQKENSEAVSNIEIIMVPFGAKERNFN